MSQRHARHTSRKPKRRLTSTGPSAGSGRGAGSGQHQKCPYVRTFASGQRRGGGCNEISFQKEILSGASGGRAGGRLYQLSLCDDNCERPRLGDGCGCPDVGTFANGHGGEAVATNVINVMTICGTKFVIDYRFRTAASRKVFVTRQTLVRAVGAGGRCNVQLRISLRSEISTLRAATAGNTPHITRHTVGG